MPKALLPVALLAALLGGLTGFAASAAAHGPDHGPQARGEEFVVQILPGQHVPRLFRQVVPWPESGVVLGHRHPRALLQTPWHYHPQGYCAPPYCLPSYHRHRLPALDLRPMPLALILQRLERIEYYGFGGFLLDGPDYWIEAWNRFGQPVRLIVNAGNGQVRGLVMLPHP